MDGSLILSRKVGEKITIGDTIEITVIDLDGVRTRLLIKAPLELKILRKELSYQEEQAG